MPKHLPDKEEFVQPFSKLTDEQWKRIGKVIQEHFPEMAIRPKSDPIRN
jgi:hypothetical protein